MIRSLSITISSTDGHGPQAELEVVFSRYDQYGTASERPEFQYAIRVPGFGSDAEGTMAYGHDLRLGSGARPDHVEAMKSLLSFLAADGEKYASAMRHGGGTTNDDLQHHSGESYLFNEQTAEFAHMLSEELALAAEELAAEEQELRDESGGEAERAYADRLLPAFRDFAAAASDHGELTVSEAINVLSDYATPEYGASTIAEKAKLGNVHPNHTGR